MPTDRLNGWIVTLIIGAIAFVIRFVNLGYPNKLVFDETYYAKDAYSLLKFGYERNWPSNANSKIIAGDLDVMQDTAAFVVHPPLGKWLIAAGEYLFGMNSFGWRFASSGLRDAADHDHHQAGSSGLQVDPDRRSCRDLAHLRRPRIRDVAYGAARHLSRVLRGSRCCLPGRRSRMVPKPPGSPSGSTARSPISAVGSVRLW